LGLSISVMNLYMILTGCRPKDRFIEQHDIFFGIASDLTSLLPDIKASWADGTVHIDAWRMVTHTNGYSVNIVNRSEAPAHNEMSLFFINLGGYKPGEFDEFHYKMVIAARNKGEAIRLAKTSAFYKHFNFPGAASHIDDKYGIDVDDIHNIEDILPGETRQRYAIVVQPANDQHTEDVLHLGYLNMAKAAKGDLSSE